MSLTLLDSVTQFVGKRKRSRVFFQRNSLTVGPLRKAGKVPNLAEDYLTHPQLIDKTKISSVACYQAGP